MPLHRWSLSEAIVGGDNLVLMLTGSLTELSRRITRNPRVGALQVKLPDEQERARFVAHIKPELPAEDAALLSRVTAGLQLRQMQDLIAPYQADVSEPSVDGADSSTLPIRRLWPAKRRFSNRSVLG